MCTWRSGRRTRLRQAGRAGADPDQVEERKERWRAGDAALLREFQEFARLVGDDYWPGQDAESPIVGAR